MMAQDLTKFTVVTVLLGIALAIAIFRPQILPYEPIQPTNQPTQNGGPTPVPVQAQGEGGSSAAEEPTPSAQCEAGLDAREARLAQRENTLDQRSTELDQRQARLDEREDALNRRSAELDEREAEMDRREEMLTQHTAELEQQDTELRKWEERLTRQEASLAEQEQRVRGFLRWSIAAAIVSSLMAVPSALVLLALAQQGQRVSDKIDKQAMPPRICRRESAPQRNWPTPASLTTVHGGDGRNKQTVSTLP